MYNEKAQKGQAANTVLLSSGAELQADLAIWTVGAKPNTEFLRASELASALDGAGRVKVRVLCHHPWTGKPFVLRDVVPALAEDNSLCQGIPLVLL